MKETSVIETKRNRTEKPLIKKRQNLAGWIAKTGILAAVAIVLMHLEFPIPLMPVFLKFDFSEVAVLLATFSMGPATGVLVEFIKNMAKLPTTHTGGVGEFANFLIGSCFVWTAGIIYKHWKTQKGAIVSLIAGTGGLILGGVVFNYLITLPLYTKIMSLDKIIEITHAAGNPLVKDLNSLLLYVFAPFNLFKGVVISLIVLVLYKRVSPLLHR